MSTVVLDPPDTRQDSCSATVGRQPIYDTQLGISGYELLFRRSGCSRLPSDAPIDGNFATATVLLDAFHVGATNLNPGQRLFVNCTRDFLMMDPVLPPDSCVLEILEDIALDEALLNRMRELKKLGYQLALDDFICIESSMPAVELADYVKIDILQYSLDSLREAVLTLKRHRAVLLAEKIETEEQFRQCRSLGFELFQGYYLRKPDVLSARRTRTPHLAALRLMLACRNPNVPIGEIARAVGSDLSLTHNLLRMANSAMYGGREPVASIGEAVDRLGTARIVRWAVLLSLTGDPNCPRGYTEMALQRACMCEAVARQLNALAPDSYFLAGLLSLLDALMGAPMNVLLSEIAVTDKLQRAVLHGEGTTGRVLNAVVAYESGDWDGVIGYGFELGPMKQAYISALAQSSEMMRMFPGS